MKLPFRSGGARLLSIKSLTLLFSMVLGPSVALAGGMPPSVEKKVPVMEESTEVEVPSPEVERPSLEVKGETETEQSAESGGSSTEALEEMAAPEKDLPTLGSGFSVGARGALSILGSDSLSGASASQYGPLGATVDYDKGYSFSLMLGYALGNGLRLEAEGGYMNNDFQGINVGTPGVFETQLVSGENELGGDLSARTLTMNAYYDINLGGGLIPYVGGGLGAADLSSEMKSTAGDLLVDDTDWIFIYQIGGGLGYKISEYSSGLDVTVSLDYRYLSSFEDPRFKQKVTGNFVEGEFGGHYIGGGIRLGLW